MVCATVDDLLGGESGFGFRLIEDEGLGADVERFVHGYGRKGGENGNEEQPVFWGEKELGEQKLLEVIDELLTTTGCGCGVRRPQPIGLLEILVNRFVERNT